MADSTSISTDNKSNIQEKPKEISEDKFKQPGIDKKSFCIVKDLIITNTLNAPFPIRLTQEQLLYNYDINYLKDYLIRDYQGVYCLNQEVIDKQSGIIKEVITQLTKCLWSGTAMSLSTKWNNKRSNNTINKMFMVRNSNESFITYKNI